MSDVAAAEGRSAGQGLTQTARVVDTFIAPSKTFTDILRDSSWWLPYVISAVVGLTFAYVILHKIGLPTLVDGVIHNSKMLEDQIANATPDVAAKIRGRIETNFKFAYAAPVIGLVVPGCSAESCGCGDYRMTLLVESRVKSDKGPERVRAFLWVFRLSSNCAFSNRLRHPESALSSDRMSRLLPIDTARPG